MKTILKAISLLGLGLTVAPALLVFGGAISWEQHAGAMLVGALLWFGSAPFWMQERADKPVS